MNRHQTVGLALAALLASLAAFPWLLGISYSKGNDFFYWLHFAWLVAPGLFSGGLPNWTMQSGCGQPMFNLDHLPDALGLALCTRFLGLEGGIRLFVVLCFGLAGMGMYRLGLELSGRRVSALLAALAFVLSWYLTRTADFYVYTSNLLQLALLPWVVFTYRHAAEGEFRMQLLGGVLTSLCITANPQMAIKVVGCAVALLLAEYLWWRRGQWRQLAGGLTVMGAVAAWLSAFHVATALIHRREIYTLGERGTIWPRDWENFTAIPRYAFDLVARHLGWEQIFSVPLWEVIDSHYEGVGVLVLALIAWRTSRGRQRAQVLVLWGLTLLTLVLFFAISWGRASEWVGTPRNMLFVSTFCLALLCGCGHAQLQTRWGARFHRWWKWGIPGVVLLELIGLKLAFFAVGPHHLPLDQIPQLRFWKQFSQSAEWGRGERFFTFKADLAFMLFPATTGQPTANIIHQRDYTAEYFSYQDAINKYFTGPGPYGAQVSEYLGLLGVRYIDLPRTGFVGRYASHYGQLLEYFRADRQLREMAHRYPDWRDEQWQRQPLGPGMVEQVIFENQRARIGWIPEHVVAIVGDTRKGERIFEALSLEPDFRFDRVLFLLCANLDELAGLADQIEGLLLAEPSVLVSGPWRQFSLEEVHALYRQDQPPAGRADLQLEQWQEERVGFSCTPAARGRFAGISLQRFSDWHASDTQGSSLRAFKAGAGLSAVYLPAGSEGLTLQYEGPGYKVGWRWFSLAGLFAVIGALVVDGFRRRRKKG